MRKEILLDMLKIQLADYQRGKSVATTDYMKSYFGGKINATLDIIDRVHILYWE